MDIVYLTTWVRYSILQIILVAREKGFTSKQLIFLSPLGGASLNSRLQFPNIHLNMAKLARYDVGDIR